MLLDPIIPSHQFAERLAATLPASPALAYRALWQVDFARSPVIRLLFCIRGLAPRFRQGGGRMHARLEEFMRAGFLLLGERPGEEVVLGVVWCGQRSGVDACRFAVLDDPGM